MTRHRHQSMHWKTARDHPKLARAELAEHRGECSLLTGTEGNALGKILKAEGWGVYHEPGDFGSGDPWVSWATDVWTKRDGWVRKLSDVTYDGRRPYCATAVLEHFRHHVEVALMCSHLPAHSSEDLQTRRETTPREKAYNDSLTTLRDMVQRQRRRHPDRRIVLVADWNVDVRTPLADSLFRAAFRGTGLDLVPIPKRSPGTHGRRLIDWALTDLEGTGRVLPKVKMSDHRPIALNYRIEDQP